MDKTIKYLINGRNPEILDYAKDQSEWLELITLTSKHLEFKNLTHDEVCRMFKLGGLFNCISNKQMKEILEVYPELDQDIFKYW